jgi:rhodanese-related sulfurtransferase
MFLNGEPVQKSYWAEGEPNNYMGVKEDCLSTFVDYPAKFYDAPCDTKLPVLCQKGGVQECQDHPHSMGTCEKRKGECKTNKAVQHLCKKTCQMCHTCEDNPESMGQCENWKKMGVCKQQQANMKYMCEKTCEMCGPEAPKEPKYVKGPDGNEYKFVVEAKSWHDAKEHCEAEGAKLARTDSKDIIVHLTKAHNEWKMRNTAFWIGVNDLMKEGDWSNSDKYPMVQTHWERNEPDNGGNEGKDEDCVSVEVGKGWRDNNCQHKMPFVCQKKGYIKGNDGREYSYHLHDVTFEVAKQVCEAEGAHLAYLDNDKTREFVGREFATRKDDESPTGLWIGGMDKESNNKWMFLNGEPVQKSYWAEGEPNNSMGVKEDCLGTFVDYPAKLYDVECNAKLKVLCQKEVESVDIEGIESTELSVLVKKRQVRIIDVRPREFLLKGRIAYARNIPLSEIKEALELTPAAFKTKYDMDKPQKEDCNLIFQCQEGIYSMRASKIAKEMGYKCHKYLVGGILAWMKAGLEVNEFERADFHKYDGMLYKYVDGPSTWQQAKESCEKMDARLMIIENQKTLKFAQFKFSQMHEQDEGFVWLGGHYIWQNTTKHGRNTGCG